MTRRDRPEIRTSAVGICEFLGIANTFLQDENRSVGVVYSPNGNVGCNSEVFLLEGAAFDVDTVTLEVIRDDNDEAAFAGDPKMLPVTMQVRLRRMAN